MLDRERAIRAAISAQGHLRTELKAPSNVWGDVARAERAVDHYDARIVAVTDEMVQRAIDGLGPWFEAEPVMMRVALEAALNPQQ